MNSLFTCEEGILSRVARHRHNNLVEDVPRAVDHIEVAISNRVEGPRIDTDFHNSAIQCIYGTKSNILSKLPRAELTVIDLKALFLFFIKLIKFS